MTWSVNINLIYESIFWWRINFVTQVPGQQLNATSKEIITVNKNLFPNHRETFPLKHGIVSTSQKVLLSIEKAICESVQQKGSVRVSGEVNDQYPSQLAVPWLSKPRLITVVYPLHFAPRRDFPPNLAPAARIQDLWDSVREFFPFLAADGTHFFVPSRAIYRNPALPPLGNSSFSFAKYAQQVCSRFIINEPGKGSVSESFLRYSQRHCSFFLRERLWLPLIS